MATLSDATSLRLANGPLAAPVLCRVVSMVMARADCPMNRLDDALLVCDAISAHAPGYAADGYVAFTLSTERGRMEMRVADLAESGARGLLADAGIPGVGNVLERLTDEVRLEPSADGGAEELVLTIGF
jgi:serine/threonine-protein kinase RsbW